MMSTKSNPIVSFIIPVYNQGQFLYDSVTSAFLSYQGKCEVIIVDDFSSDSKTDKFLDEIILLYPSIKLIRHETNQGLSAARNTGIKASSGEFIQLLDADDVLIPGKVDYQIAHFNLSKKMDVSVTNYLLGDESLIHFDFPESIIGNFNLELQDFLYKWERGLSIPIHCALFKRELLLGNLFVEELRAKEDWVFWSKLANNGTKIVYLNTLGVIYRQHKSAMTKALKKKMGDSWIAASIIINQSLSQPDSNFIASALKWHKEIYANEIEENVENDVRIKYPNNKATNESHIDRGVYYRSIEESSASVSTSKCLLTIFIPIYNHFSYLPKCISSILPQANEEVEILCIDDNSTDPRVIEYLTQLSNDNPQIRIIMNDKNFGISETSNQGAKLARGEYIAFLDCDDYLSEQAIARVLAAIKSNQDVDYFFTDRIEIDEQDRIIRTAIYGGYKNILPSRDIAADLQKGMIASHLKVIRKSKIEDVNGFDPMLAGVQDWDLALKISLSGKFLYIPEPLYFHRIHSNSVTNSAKVAQFRKTNIARRRHFVQRFNHMTQPSDAGQFLQSILDSTVEKIHLDHRDCIVISDYDLPLEVLNHIWEKYRLICFDSRGAYDINVIDFIKEYNSYFDAIACDDPRVMASISSYLWDINVLVFPWKQGQKDYTS